MKKIYSYALLAGFTLLFFACQKDPDFNYYYYSKEDYAMLSHYLNLPEIPFDFTLKSPSKDNGFIGVKPINRDKAMLGLVLFYDKHLSKDGTIACGSCHKQEHAFGDNTAVSKGVFDRSGDRNSIALMSVSSFSAQYGEDLNGSLGKRFFWDNRAPTAAEQSIGSMTNPKEMDMGMDEIVAAVESQPYYEPLFRKAYGSAAVTQGRVTEAIAEFVNSIGSLNSRFDAVVEQNRQQGNFDVINSPLNGFTAQENHGKSVYMLNCGVCHGFDQRQNVFVTDANGLFLPMDRASNGLDATTTDRGVGAISGKAEDEGTFKVPTLRNVALSAPYMHDGRFKTLEEVVEHYNSGIQPHPNLHFQLRNPDGSPKRLNLSAEDKAALVVFLKTLTDEEIIKDVRFADPFRQ